MATTTTHTEERSGNNQGACCWPALESVERSVETARRVVNDARHVTDEIAQSTAERVRQHPLAAIGAAAAAGIVVGSLAGLAYAFFGRRKA